MMIVEIAGHLGADPEVRFTPSGQKVVSFRIAANTRKGGKDETAWWRVTIWGDRFDKMLPYLKKGSAVIVIGEMQKPEIWNDKEGRPQVSLDVTADIIRFSPFGRTDRPEQGQGNQQNQGSTQYQQHNNQYQAQNQAQNQAQSQQPYNAYNETAAYGSNQNSLSSHGSAAHSNAHEEDEPLPF